MKYIFVANWKMNSSLTHAIDYCTNHTSELQDLSDTNDIVICPSFIAIQSVQKALHNTSIAIGAQTCSPYTMGPYTGQVSAMELKEAGCTYCIVGHSEQREYCHQTNEDIALQVDQLLANNITPIICIGESSIDYFNHATYEVLSDQLMPIISVLQQIQSTLQIYVAYEPTWAIGQTKIPEPSYLEKIFAWLKQDLQTHLPENTCIFLYGGSVNEHSIKILTQIRSIQGFLIGSASTDFNHFKKIIDAARQ